MTVHFRQQAGAAASSAIAGDVTGTLPATTVAKVAGVTPTTPGLALLTAPTFAEALALLGAERAPVNAATTTTLPSYTRLGNVLTGTANGALAAQDGVSLILGQRLLVKNETGGNQPYNGIYTVTQLGVVAVSPFILTRSADCDTSAEITGAFTEVLAGTVNTGSQWVMTTQTPTLGTTALTWQEYGGVSPFGTVGGDLTGTLPNPTVATVSAAALPAPVLNTKSPWTPGKLVPGDIWIPNLIGTGATTKALNAADTTYAILLPVETADVYPGVNFKNTSAIAGKNARMWLGVIDPTTGKPGAVHWYSANQSTAATGEKPLLFANGTWLVATYQSGNNWVPPLGSLWYLAIETDATTCGVAALAVGNARPIRTVPVADSSTFMTLWLGSHVFGAAAPSTFGTATPTQASVPLLGVIVG